MLVASANSLQLSPPSAAPATEFVKYSLDGKEASFVNVALDSSSHLLWMVPKSASAAFPSSMPLDLLQLKFVESGNRPRDNSRLKKLLNCPKITPSQCLSLYFGEWPWKAYHVAYPSSRVTQFWLEKLNTFITSSSSVPSASHIDTWLQRLYAQLKQKHGDELHTATVLGAFSRDRIWKGLKLLKDLEKEDPSLASIPERNPSFSDCKSLYFSYVSTWRHDIRRLYQKYSNNPSKSEAVATPEVAAVTTTPRRKSIAVMGFKSKPSKPSNPPSTIKLDLEATMSTHAFTTFLAASQNRETVGVSEVAAIIAKYDTFAEKNDLDHITLKGFTHYLLSQEMSPPPHVPSKPLQQKLDQPLSDYLIASSHNTYLTGHQLHGESSVSMYAKVLHSGCRCVELDAWDGEDGEPVIYHGYTLTSKIKLKAVIDTIAKHAFAASPYPLILSLENHCCLSQQRKIVQYMKTAFGDMLLTPNDQEGVRRLPSPEELKYKILIKHRKIQNIDGAKESRDGGPLNFPGPATTGDSKRRGSVFPHTRPVQSNACTPYHAAKVISHHSSCPTSPDARALFRIDMPKRSHSTEMLYSESPLVIDKPTEKDKNVHHPALSRTDSNLSMYTIFEEDKPPSSTHTSGGLKRKSRLSFRQKTSSSKQQLCRKKAFPLNEQEDMARLERSFSRIADIDATRSTMQGWADDESPATTEQSLDKFPEVSEKTTSLIEDCVMSSPSVNLKPRLTKTAIVRENTVVACSVPAPEKSEETKEIKILAPSPVDTKITTPAVGIQDLKSTSLTLVALTSHPTDGKRPKLDLLLPLNKQDDDDDTDFCSPQRRLSSPQLGEASRNPEPLHLSALLSPHPQRSLSFQSALTAKKPVQRPQFLQILPNPDLSPARHPLDHSNSYALDDEGPGETTQQCCDTAEASYNSKDIARELSDMVIYTEPVKFTGFKGQEHKFSEMYSLSESTAKKALKKTSQEFLDFNEAHLSRIYPSASRIRSSNFNPAYFWLRGCQMIALNYQTNDTPMQHNMALFKQNAGFGYIPKPENWKERAEEVLAGLNINETQLTITVLSGQFLATHYPPIVEIEVMGIPKDAYKVKFQAGATDEAGNYTSWENATLTTSVTITTYAVVKFSIFQDKSSGHPLHSHIVPLATLSSGFQHVYFDDSVTYDLFHPPPSLFMCVQVRGTDVREPCGSLSVKLSVKETVKDDFVILKINEAIFCEELLGRVIRKAGLEGTNADYSLYRNEHLVESTSVLEAKMEGLEIRDSPPCLQSQPQLAMVTIYYSDLPGVDCDSTTLFAGPTTTATDLIAATVAGLGSELAKVYPEMEDCEDEEKLNSLFCLVYAHKGDSTLRRQEVLLPDSNVLDLFADSDPDSCLLLHTKEQDHRIISPSQSCYCIDDFSSHNSTSTVVNVDSTEELDGDTLSTNDETPCEEGNHPVSIRYVSPEVAQRSLEEYFRNVKLRVCQEESRLAQEQRGRRHNVHDEYFVEEGPLVKDAVSTPQQGTFQQLGKTKKSKRWFKKFGTHSLDSSGRHNQADFLEDEEKRKPSKKRWSFGSTFTKVKTLRVRRSSSLHSPSRGKVNRVVELKKNPIAPDTSEPASDKCYEVI